MKRAYCSLDYWLPLHDIIPSMVINTTNHNVPDKNTFDNLILINSILIKDPFRRLLGRSAMESNRYGHSTSCENVVGVWKLFIVIALFVIGGFLGNWLCFLCCGLFLWSCFLGSLGRLWGLCAASWFSLCRLCFYETVIRVKIVNVNFWITITVDLSVSVHLADVIIVVTGVELALFTVFGRIDLLWSWKLALVLVYR